MAFNPTSLLSILSTFDILRELLYILKNTLPVEPKALLGIRIIMKFSNSWLQQCVLCGQGWKLLLTYRNWWLLSYPPYLLVSFFLFSLCSVRGTTFLSSCLRKMNFMVLRLFFYFLLLLCRNSRNMFSIDPIFFSLSTNIFPKIWGISFS